MEKTKLMWVGDYSNTGFGTVAKGLLRGLHDTGKYEILQVGINYSDIDENPEPWRIVPAGFWHLSKDGKQLIADDAYGYLKVNTWIDKFDPDIVIVNNDYLIARNYMFDNKRQKPTKFSEHRSIKVLYSPVDSDPVPPIYADIAKMYDLNIAYSDWQRNLMAKHDPVFALMPILYHGYDDKTLAPMDKDEAKYKLIQVMAKYNKDVPLEVFEEKFIGKYIVYFVGTNQFRKDLPCLFRAYALFQDDVDNAFLIPHTNTVPSGESGWILTNLQELTETKDIMFLGKANIFTPEEMNIFYNAADVLAYPTRGEGFGLPSFEAMAVKTPVIATRFGPQEEIHKNGRGYFIDIRDVIPGDVFAWSYFVLPDHRSLYQQLKFVHDNPDHARETADRAYEFVKDYTWPNQSLELDKILSNIPSREPQSGE